MQQKRNMISQILFKEWDKLILSFPDNINIKIEKYDNNYSIKKF